MKLLMLVMILSIMAMKPSDSKPGLVTVLVGFLSGSILGDPGVSSRNWEEFKLFRESSPQCTPHQLVESLHQENVQNHTIYSPELCEAGQKKIVQKKTHKAVNSLRPVGVWGACFDQGQPHQGVGDAPSLMRKAGLTSKLRSLGCDLTDHGDISIIRDKNVDTMEERKRQSFIFARQAQDRVHEILDQGQVCLTLGGDHSIGMGTVAGHLAKHPDAVVLWVDAHADINTFNTSESGNVHGMSLSFNIPQLKDTGLGDMADWLSPALQPERLAYIGLRDVDEGEKQILADLGITSFYIEDVDRLGIVKTVEEALLALDHTQTRPIHMSFDIDVLDPSEAPATGTSVKGGLSLKEGLTLCEMVHSTGRLQAVDLVEVNPEIAKNQEEIDRTVRAANNIILASLGYSVSPPMHLYF